MFRLPLSTVNTTGSFFKSATNLLGKRTIFTSFKSSPDLVDTTHFVKIPDFSYFFTFSSKHVYQSAIYAGPTFRFIDINLNQPKLVDKLLKDPRKFVSNSLYRSYLHLTEEEYLEKTKNFGDLDSRLASQPFYGIGGCADLESVRRYQVKHNYQGVYIGINTVSEADKTRVKINLNALYKKVYGVDNFYNEENEILKLYLDPYGNLLRNPIGQPNDYLDLTAFIVDSKHYSDMKDGNAVPNLLNNGELIKVDKWFEEQAAQVKPGLRR